MRQYFSAVAATVFILRSLTAQGSEAELRALEKASSEAETQSVEIVKSAQAAKARMEELAKKADAAKLNLDAASAPYDIQAKKVHELYLKVKDLEKKLKTAEEKLAEAARASDETSVAAEKAVIAGLPEKDRLIEKAKSFSTHRAIAEMDLKSVGDRLEDSRKSYESAENVLKPLETAANKARLETEKADREYAAAENEARELQEKADALHEKALKLSEKADELREKDEEISGREAPVSLIKNDIQAMEASDEAAITGMKYRLEAALSFDQNFPASRMGSWEGFSLSFFHTPTENITYFLQAQYMNYNGESDGLFTFGLYADAASWFNLYADASGGTVGDYSYRFRGDLLLNFPFKAGPLIITPNAGLIYIRGFGGQSDLSPYPGLELTYRQLSIEYQLYFNLNFPGTVLEFSHHIILSWIEHLKHETYLTVEFGRQGYLSTANQTIVDNYLVNNPFWSITLTHRHYITEKWGLFGSIDYYSLFNPGGYDKVGIQFGGFRAF